MNVTDPEQVRKDKTKFLVALLEMCQEANQDPMSCCPHADEIGERCGFDKEYNGLIYMDLMHENLIWFMATGPLCCLRPEGRDQAEQHLFDNSAKGKVRSVTSKSTELAKTGISKAAVLVWTAIGGTVGTIVLLYFKRILKWLGIETE